MLNRRLFLFGTGAAIAVAKIGIVAADSPSIVPLVTNKRLFKHRAAYDIFASFQSPVSGAISFQVGIAGLRRLPLFNFAANKAGGALRWVAAPGNEIVLLPNDALRFDVDGLDSNDDCDINVVTAEHDHDDAVPIRVLETWKFNGQKLVLRDTDFLEVDNTLEARRARFKQLKDQPPFDWDALDKEDELEDSLDYYRAVTEEIV